MQAGAGGTATPTRGSRTTSSGTASTRGAAIPTSTTSSSSKAREPDPKRRQAILHQIQRLAHERIMHAPLWELGFLNAIGPRVEESGLGLIALHPYSAPYEDFKLRK